MTDAQIILDAAATALVAGDRASYEKLRAIAADPQAMADLLAKANADVPQPDKESPVNPMTTLLDAALLAAERGDHDAIGQVQDAMLDPSRSASVIEQAGRLAAMEDTGEQPETFRKRPR